MAVARLNAADEILGVAAGTGDIKPKTEHLNFDVVPAYSKVGPELSEKHEILNSTTTTTTGKKEIQNSVKVKHTPTLAEAFDTVAKDVICAMGPQTSFFYYGGNPNISWTYWHDRYEVPFTVSGASVRSWEIKQAYHVALSPHGAGYFAYNSYTDGLAWRFIDISPSTRPTKRKFRQQKKFDETVKAYARLTDWLRRNVNTSDDIKTVRIAFGPMARYLAWKPSGEFISNDLPVMFQREWTKRRVAHGNNTVPRQATFGVGRAWAAIWQDDTHNIDTDGRYPSLDQELLDEGDCRLKFIALSCIGRGDEYLLLCSGKKQYYRASAARRAIINEDWSTQLREWSRHLDIPIKATTSGIDGYLQRTIDPGHAEAFEKFETAQKEVDKENLATTAAQISIESSQRSMAASKVAVGAGVVAIAAACTVM